MPLVKIRVSRHRIADEILLAVIASLKVAAADALSCKEGGDLEPKDIMIEVDEKHAFDCNTKDINIRVSGHNYKERLDRHDAIRKRLSEEVLRYLPGDVSWYMWVELKPVSYCSDTKL